MRYILTMMLVGMLGTTGCARYKAGVIGDGVDVIAHRGASAYAPENTLSAFQMAEEMGADWIELDCRLTRDNEVVVIHDDTLDRTTSGSGYVREASLHEIKQLDAGSWFEDKWRGERVPTLDQVFEYAKGRIGVYVEIKDSADDGPLISDIRDLADGLQKHDSDFRKDVMDLIERSETRNLMLTRKVIELARKHKMERYMVVQSFSPTVIAIMAIEAPEFRVEFLGADDPDSMLSWEQYLRWGYLFDVDGFNLPYQSLSPGRLAAIHRAEKSVNVWTVNDVDEMKTILAWGIDGIITDKPAIAKNHANTVGAAMGIKEQDL